jgi:hypothetical protein
MATRIVWTIFSIGDEILLARDKLAAANLHLAGLSGSICSDGALPLGGVYYSAPLSDRQWQLEVYQMISMALAKMQRILVYRPAPPPAHLNITYEGKNFIVPLATDAQRKLCSQQKAKSPQQRSFSVFGIFIIISFGLLTVALRFSLPRIIGLVKKRRASQRHRRRMENWTQMDVLHLMSFLLEDENNVKLEGRDGSVPVTMQKRKMLRWAPRSGKQYNLTINAWDLGEEGA